MNDMIWYDKVISNNVDYNEIERKENQTLQVNARWQDQKECMKMLRNVACKQTQARDAWIDQGLRNNMNSDYFYLYSVANKMHCYIQVFNCCGVEKGNGSHCGIRNMKTVNEKPNIRMWF